MNEDAESSLVGLAERVARQLEDRHIVNSYLNNT